LAGEGANAGSFRVCEVAVKWHWKLNLWGLDAVDRVYWQQLAEIRVKDAEALLNAGRWSAAYYLAGYAIECGLKACVVAYVENAPEIVFQERRFSEKCWVHDLEKLVDVARLTTDFEADRNANPMLQANWDTVKSWREDARYQQTTETDARSLYEAVTDHPNGVMQWIMSHW
jgi:HEPN domain-containing protein